MPDVEPPREPSGTGSPGTGPPAGIPPRSAAGHQGSPAARPGPAGALLPSPPRCLVMGVVNVTPDSFSDGGKWFGAPAAIEHGLELIAQGADIVDVGGASSRPGARRV